MPRDRTRRTRKRDQSNKVTLLGAEPQVEPGSDSASKGLDTYALIFRLKANRQFTRCAELSGAMYGNCWRARFGCGLDCHPPAGYGVSAALPMEFDPSSS